MAIQQERQISRRGFLAGAGAAAGLAALGLDACARPRPTPVPLEIVPLRTPEARFACRCCGEILENQPALEEHIASLHFRKLPPIQRVDQPTYAQFVVGTVERFDQKNEMFSRQVWDTGYQEMRTKVTPRQRGESPAELLEGRALQGGGIYVDKTAGNLHPAYYGYDGHVRGLGGLYNWDDPVSPEKYPVSDPAKMSERIKYVAKMYGASLVGICRIDPRWVYSNYFDRVTGTSGELELPYQYAIVLGIEMNWAEIETSPGFGASAATSLAYSQMAELSATLAKYIRGLGYPAVPSGNDTAQSIPLAIDAGLGQLGRCGLMVSPQFGPRQRLCKVFTDLPLQPDQPIDFGLHNFCPKCGICARNCPAGAIRRGERTTEPTSISNRPGILRWPVDVVKCHLFWLANGSSCSNCVAACPWGWQVRRWL